MYVCLCKGITDSHIRQAGREGAACAESLIASFQLDGDECCGYCRENIDHLVDMVRREIEPELLLPMVDSGR